MSNIVKGELFEGDNCLDYNAKPQSICGQPAGSKHHTVREDVLAGIKLVGEASKRSRSKSKVTCKFGGARGDRELSR